MRQAVWHLSYAPLRLKRYTCLLNPGNFVSAWLMGMLLDSAEFYDADMSNATLRWATCNNTDFSTAKNLTTEMLKYIIYDAETPSKAPEGVAIPPPREK